MKKLIKKILITVTLTGAFIGSVNATVSHIDESTVTNSAKIQVGINVKIFMTPPDDLIISFLDTDNLTHTSRFCIATNQWRDYKGTLRMSSLNQYNGRHNLRSGDKLHPYDITILNSGAFLRFTPDSNEYTLPVVNIRCEGYVPNNKLIITIDNPEGVVPGIYTDIITFTTSLVPKAT